jgi:hypothetical protein
LAHTSEEIANNDFSIASSFKVQRNNPLLIVTVNEERYDDTHEIAKLLTSHFKVLRLRIGCYPETAYGMVEFTVINVLSVAEPQYTSTDWKGSNF